MYALIRWDMMDEWVEKYSDKCVGGSVEGLYTVGVCTVLSNLYILRVLVVSYTIILEHSFLHKNPLSLALKYMK